MRTLSKGDLIVVALDPGEEIVASLLEVARENKLQGGLVTGLGSTSEVELAFFDPAAKEYLPRVFKEPMELGCLVGNFSVLEGEPHVHLHATVSGQELIAFTGHLSRGVVGTGCEIYVQKFPKEVARVRDPDRGFNPLRP